MTAAATKVNGQLEISPGCSLENLALSVALREMALKPDLLPLMETFEVKADCDGCADGQRECVAETDPAKPIDLSDCDMARAAAHGHIKSLKDYR